MRHNNITTCTYRGTRRKREQGVQNLFEERMTKNFPNIVKKKDTQLQEEQRVPNKMNPKRSTPRHVIIKMAKVKGKKES